MVQDGDGSAGDILAKIPREKTNQDQGITGGLPRVVELFEARKRANRGDLRKSTASSSTAASSRTAEDLSFRRAGAEPREYALRAGVQSTCRRANGCGRRAVMDGPSNPHDILNVLGEKAAAVVPGQRNPEVYRLQGVNITDKHIEVIARQMMRWGENRGCGDTSSRRRADDKFRFLEETSA